MAGDTATTTIDMSLKLPSGVTAVDQENASALLQHMHELNAAWVAVPPANGEMAQPELALVGAEVEWLQRFCEQLVEQSLRSSWSADEAERPRKKQRRPTMAPDQGSFNWGLTPLASTGDGPSWAEMQNGSSPPQEGGASEASFDVDELLGLVASDHGVRGLLLSPRGVPLVTLAHGLHSPLAPLASPLAIFDCDFTAGVGALASPLAFLSTREVEDLQRQSPPLSARTAGTTPLTTPLASSEVASEAGSSPQLSSLGYISDSDSYPDSAMSDDGEQGASMGTRRRPGGATNLFIGSADNSAVVPMGALSASGAPATPASAYGLGRFAELAGGFVSPSIFSALQCSAPWMRPGSALAPSTPMRHLVASCC